MSNRHDCVLTNREREVLCLVARGMSNQEIADFLCTSTSTVKMFIYQACIKLRANNRAQAFITAVRDGGIRVFDVFTLEEVVDLLSSLDPEAIDKIAQLLKLRLEQQKTVPQNSQFAAVNT